jgi:hypothetical protein
MRLSVKAARGLALAVYLAPIMAPGPTFAADDAGEAISDAADDTADWILRLFGNREDEAGSSGGSNAGDGDDGGDDGGGDDGGGDDGGENDSGDSDGGDSDGGDSGGGDDGGDD